MVDGDLDDDVRKELQSTPGGGGEEIWKLGLVETKRVIGRFSAVDRKFEISIIVRTMRARKMRDLIG